MKNMSQFETEAPILQKTTDLYKELYEHLKTFPKEISICSANGARRQHSIFWNISFSRRVPLAS